MKTLTFALMSAMLIPGWGAAQSLNLSFDQLSAKAREKAEINLDEAALKLAFPLAEGKNPAASKLAGLKGLAVRHYEFAAAGEYSESDLAPLHKQLDSSWSRVLTTKEKDESVEILYKKGAPSEFLLIAAKAKELTVVHAVGTLELANLQEVVTSTIAFGSQKKPDKN